MTSRHKKRLMMLVAILLSPLFLLALVDGLNVFNPMFMSTFEIENKTDTEILVTPIGAIGRSGDCYPLAHSASSTFNISVPYSADYPIAPGGVWEFTYTNDDIYFSDILVRRASQEYRVFSIGSLPTKDGNTVQEHIRYEITDLDSAPLAQQKHLVVLPEGWSRIWTIYLLDALGLASPVLFFRALRMKD